MFSQPFPGTRSHHDGKIACQLRERSQLVFCFLFLHRAYYCTLHAFSPECNNVVKRTLHTGYAHDQQTEHPPPVTFGYRSKWSKLCATHWRVKAQRGVKRISRFRLPLAAPLGSRCRPSTMGFGVTYPTWLCWWYATESDIRWAPKHVRLSQEGAMWFALWWWGGFCNVRKVMQPGINARMLYIRG